MNNAAQVVVKPAVECTAEDYSGLMVTNLESCFHLSQLAHPLLRNSAIASGGSIVHISSIASYLGSGFTISLEISRYTRYFGFIGGVRYFFTGRN